MKITKGFKKNRILLVLIDSALIVVKLNMLQKGDSKGRISLRKKTILAIALKGQTHKDSLPTFQKKLMKTES